MTDERAAHEVRVRGKHGSHHATRASAYAAAGVIASAVFMGCIESPPFSELETTLDASTASEGALAADASVAMDATAAEDASEAARAMCEATCSAAGGTCDGPTCVFACPGLASCATEIRCPVGVPCRVTCRGTKACSFVTCGSAPSCQIECTGQDACERVTSAAADTQVVCGGKNSCKKVSCNGASCSVQCEQDSCKPAEVACCAAVCTVNAAPGTCK